MELKDNIPQVKIITDGITNTKVLIDGKELKGVTGISFFQSHKENQGLPTLRIDLKATNVELDAKVLPTLPEPFAGHYISIAKLLSSKQIAEEQVVRICREYRIDLS